MNQNRHSKHQKMTAVREAGFCMIDAGMYLDTHPCDGKAMDYFNRYQQMYKEAVRISFSIRSLLEPSFK